MIGLEPERAISVKTGISVTTVGAVETPTENSLAKLRQLDNIELGNSTIINLFRNLDIVVADVTPRKPASDPPVENPRDGVAHCSQAARLSALLQVS